MLPAEYETYSSLTDDDIDFPELRIFPSATSIVRTIVQQIDPETAEQFIEYTQARVGEYKYVRDGCEKVINDLDDVPPATCSHPISTRSSHSSGTNSTRSMSIERVAFQLPTETTDRTGTESRTAIVF